MVEGECRSRRLKEIVDQSRFWDAEYLLRNMERELDRLEKGLDHMIWDLDGHRVTAFLSPLPTTPRFDVSTDENGFTVKVLLPGIPQENVSINVDVRSIEVLACSADIVCRPYYVDIEADAPLSPETAEAEFAEGVLEIRVTKAKKTRVRVR